MAPAIEFIGTLKHGFIQPPAEYGPFMRQREGRQVRVVLSENAKKRSCKQNAFYWGQVVAPVLDLFLEWGNEADEDDVHEFLKERFCSSPKILMLQDGKRAPVLKSTTKLTTLEFSDYVEKIRAWAAQYDTQIPLPSEQN